MEGFCGKGKSMLRMFSGPMPIRRRICPWLLRQKLHGPSPPEPLPYLSQTLPFFRHPDGRQFGQKYFYKWWKRACKELNIEDVDLYGGTRHSTVRALRKRRTPEEIRRASGHSTNKAFERCYHTEGDMLRAIYDDAQGGKEVAKIPAPRKRT
jgi:hypothetical protein